MVLVIDISGYGYKIKGNDYDIMNFIQLSFDKLFKKSTYVFFPQSFGPFEVRGENPIDKANTKTPIKEFGFCTRDHIFRKGSIFVGYNGYPMVG